MIAGQPSTAARPARVRGADRGQSTVEVALALPLVVLVLLLVVQVGLVVRDKVLVTGAAARAGRLDPSGLAVDVTPRPDGTVEVRVRYRSRTELPLIGSLVPDVGLSAVAVMRRE